MKANTMLVGTDFSDASVWAANHAAEFAKKLNYELNLVHIVDPAMEDHSFLPDYTETEDRLDDVGKEIKDKWEIPVVTNLYKGSPGKTLARLSCDEKITMVAVGYSGKSGLLSRIGSVASQAVRLVDKPILVLVPNHHTEGPVIGCIDFSDGTERINYWTHCMANIQDKEPVFAHVAVPYEVLLAGTPSLGGIGMIESVIEHMGGSEEGYRARLEASVRHRLGIGMKGEVYILLDKSCSKAIGKFAESKNAGLLVMGRHGHNTLGSRIIGSTAEHILGLSETSTLVLP